MRAYAVPDATGLIKLDAMENPFSLPVELARELGEHLANAMLLTYPDAGHGSLFQWHESFQHHVTEFLASNSPFAPY